MSKSLEHIGVLGMRWGHRKASTSSADHMKVLGLKKKKLHEMSNEEIRTLTTRMQLESQYRNLNPSKITRGKKVVGGTVSMLGKVVATAGTISAAAALGKKVYEYAMGRAVARAFTK